MRPVTDREVNRVPGWFGRIDMAVFRVLLGDTARHSGGDLAELGVYCGKSAILIGSYLRPGETFTVIDLFGVGAKDSANRDEIKTQYANLTRDQFERAYQAIHGDLPVVVQGSSPTIVQHAAHGTHRFVHIDASHLYEQVVADLAAARVLLKSSGVVVVDDYRSEHTPGVAAAAWQGVGEGLHPFLLTPAKMYATWGDPTPWKNAIESWLIRSGDGRHEHQVIGGSEVTRVWNKTNNISRYLPPATLPPLSRLRAKFGK